ncbi:hypothetical protein Hanom_Chr09g00771081 [Helianthus anomalus]
MSGEGSSSSTGRKRRASTRSQGTAEAQQPTDMPLRMIQYHGPGVPHRQSTVLRDSPLLQFAEGTAEWSRFHVLGAVQL